MILKRIVVDEKRFIVLRQLTKDDIHGIYEYSKKEEVVEYLMYEKHNDIVQTKDMFNNFFKPIINGSTSGIYAIESINNFAGIIGFRKITDNEIIIWYVLDIQYWNKKIMSKCLIEVIQYIRKTFPEYSIVVNHMKNNIASQKIIEKVGFIQDKIQKSVIKGKEQELVWYRILPNKAKKEI
jgi:ribosomal-protein-alanine N-acetyltransferase